MSATRGLTTRQAQVLDAVDTLTRAHGYPPTVREVGEHVGLASPSSVLAHLRTLETVGLVSRRPGSPRSWLAATC